MVVMSNLTYSFDIFDTCLIRKCGIVDFVFEILAKRILGTQISVSQCRDFVKIRKDGECMARKEYINSEREDITILDIYNCCDFSSLTNTTNDEILKVELLVEKDNLIANNSLKREIDKIHALNENVIFISDMYLPLCEIQSILEREGLYVKGDRLYISGEIGKTKDSGRLYDYIQADLKLNKKKWVHKGNNMYSDVKVPMRKGIRASFVDTRLNAYEKDILKSDNVNPSFGIFKSVCISRGIRLSMEDESHVRFASTFIAPIYVPFVHSIFEDAMKRGIKKLFFLARDGYILYNIAKEFSDLYPEIDVHYIYVSRKSLYLPGLQNIDIASVSSIIPNLANKQLGELIDILHLSRRWCYGKEKRDAYDGLKELFDIPDFVEELKYIYLEQRNACYKYFKQVGLTESNCAIVDIAGSRRCQQAINRVLANHHHQAVYGYYFEVMPKRITGGDYMSFLFQECFSVYRFYDFQILFEQYFSATLQDRTVGYKDSNGIVEPIFEKEICLNDILDKIVTINKEVCIKYVKAYKQLPLMGPSYVSMATLNVFSKFCYKPRKDYLEALKGFKWANSKIDSNYLLSKQNFIRLFFNRKSLWWYGNLLYNSSKLYPLMYYFLHFVHLYMEKKKNSNLFRL